jgi:hypothetical protein
LPTLGEDPRVRDARTLEHDLAKGEHLDDIVMEKRSMVTLFQEMFEGSADPSPLYS